MGENAPEELSSLKFLSRANPEFRSGDAETLEFSGILTALSIAKPCFPLLFTLSHAACCLW